MFHLPGASDAPFMTDGHAGHQVMDEDYHILNHRDPGEFESVITSLNTTLAELIKDHLSGAKMRAKIKHLNNDDQPTRFLLLKEKKLQQIRRRHLKYSTQIILSL